MKWDLRFLELARHISTWSKDNSTQCGAVIVRPDRAKGGWRVTHVFEVAR